METKLTSPTQVLGLLREQGLQPSTVLGQNFLVDANIRDMIIATAAPGPSDAVLEIGPGLGVLTERLVECSGKVVAVEKDRALCRILRERLAGHSALELIEGDALDIDPAFLAGRQVNKVVSNLPYSVGSRVLMNFFSMPDPPERLVVMVQLEVAERLAAGAGAPQRGLLGVWAQRSYTVALAKVISRNCFIPRPKVQSAVVVMDRRTDLAPAGNRALFESLTKEAFSYRRKQMSAIMHRIAGSLALTNDEAQGVLEEVGLEARIRPELLGGGEWQHLADAIARVRAGRAARHSALDSSRVF